MAVGVEYFTAHGEGCGHLVVRVAANWLIHDRDWSMSSCSSLMTPSLLRASQRRLDFGLAGHVRTWVDSVVTEFDDRLYIVSAGERLDNCR